MRLGKRGGVGHASGRHGGESKRVRASKTCFVPSDRHMHRSIGLLLRTAGTGERLTERGQSTKGGEQYNVYTIVLERIRTGEPSLAIVTRQDNEEAARAYVRQLRNHRTCGSGKFMPAPMMLLRGGSGPHGWSSGRK